MLGIYHYLHYLCSVITVTTGNNRTIIHNQAMKQTFFSLLLALLCLSSCKTAEKVVYFQDAESGESFSTQATQALTLVPGDKIGVMVTSASTPDLALRYNLQVGQTSSTTQNYDNQRYTIDENGNIDMPGIGRISVSGLTRAEAAKKIQTAFREGVLNDAVVTVAAYNRYVTVLGDVARPGQQEIRRDNITILEALGQAGDLTITARRDRVRVVRQEGNMSKTYFIDLRSKDMFSSPVYNLKQNDVVYVEPNKVKMGQSTNNDNSVRNISTWLSVTSVLTSIAILIFR